MKRSHDVDLDALMQSLLESHSSDNPRGVDADSNGGGTDHDDQ
ncbi:MAG TPA: hypothetical protein VM282_09605 [Acidimicrobiales bacterium]|nr:hypothetical protein [Acidimicrobiales bacterium]